MKEENISLDQLSPGCTGIVVDNHCEDRLRQRLSDLGLTEGTEVLCLYESASGSPIAYDILGAAIALRRVDAAQIQVEARQ